MSSSLVSSSSRRHIQDYEDTADNDDEIATDTSEDIVEKRNVTTTTTWAPPPIPPPPVSPPPVAVAPPLAQTSPRERHVFDWNRRENAKPQPLTANRTRYMPSTISKRYADPFIALRAWHDNTDAVTIGVVRRANDDPSVKSPRAMAAKKGSLRKIASALTSGSSTSSDAAAAFDRHQQRADAARSKNQELCALALSKQLSFVVDAFVAFVLELTRIRNAEQTQDVETLATYFLLDSTITQRAEMRRLRLCDADLAITLGKAATEMLIFRDALDRGSSIAIARRRYDAVYKHADLYLLLACNNNTDRVRAILPLVWQWDEAFDDLKPAALEPAYMRCRRDLIFIVIGMMDVLGFRELRDQLAWDLYESVPC